VDVVYHRYKKVFDVYLSEKMNNTSFGLKSAFDPAAIAKQFRLKGLSEEY